jgi:CBS domain containing-hemolysin-like protein
MPAVLAAVFATILVALFGILAPFLYGEKLGLQLTTWFAPIAAKMLTVMQPVTRPIADRIDIAIGKKSVLYSKEQLLKVIDAHANTDLTDISVDEALLVRNSLSFSDRFVKDIMVPRNMVSMVASNAEIGPLMMDEMHQSGHSRFPVFQHDNPDQIIGMLYLHNLVGDKKSGSVSKLMSNKVYFVHEELDLNHVLHAFLKTKNHLFIVVNNFEEFVGVISIEDILEQILGRQIVDEFDNYENLREVAGLRAKKQASKNSHV